MQINDIFLENDYDIYYQFTCDNPNTTIEEIGKDNNGNRQFKLVEIPAYVPSMEELEKQYTDYVQVLIDTQARSKGYDDGKSCVSYYNSTNAKFRHEAEDFTEWRDRVWELCYLILDKVKAGEKYNPAWVDVLPTYEELENELPELEW